jgi:hypothetical protein
LVFVISQFTFKYLIFVTFFIVWVLCCQRYLILVLNLILMFVLLYKLVDIAQLSCFRLPWIVVSFLAICF